MSKLKSIVVRSGQHIELAQGTTLLLGGVLRDLRPRTPDAVRTLLGQLGKTTARLHDEKSFEVLDSRKGRFELLPGKDGRIQGLSSPSLIAVVRALPSRPAMPKTVELPRSESNCACNNSRRPKMKSVRRSVVYDYPDFVLPDWLRNLEFFRVVAFFQDIVVERGALLTINVPTLAARNFILHTGGRVKQRGSLVMDLSGSFRAGAAADG